MLSCLSDLTHLPPSLSDVTQPPHLIRFRQASCSRVLTHVKRSKLSAIQDDIPSVFTACRREALYAQPDLTIHSIYAQFCHALRLAQFPIALAGLSHQPSGVDSDWRQGQVILASARWLSIPLGRKRLT